MKSVSFLINNTKRGGVLSCLKLLLLFVVLSTNPHPFMAAEVETVVATEEQKTSLIQLYSWATILPKALIDLQDYLDGDNDIEKVDKELPGLIVDAEELSWDSSRAKTTANLQLMVVTNYQNRVHNLSARLEKLSKPIATAIEDLSLRRKEWQTKKAQIESFENSDVLVLGLADQQLQRLMETTSQAFELIEKRLALALSLGKKIGDVQILLYDVESDLLELSKELISVSIQQTSPSMLSADFYSRINRNLFQQTYSIIKQVSHQQLTFLKKNLSLVLLSLASLLVVAYVLRKTREVTPTSSRWYPFATCHLATAVFLAANIYGVLDLLKINLGLPKNWEFFFNIVMMFAVIRLTSHLVHSKWQRGLFIPLTSFTAITSAMVMVKVPQVLILLYVFYVSLSAFIFYLYQLPGTRGLPKKEAWFRRSLGLFPAVILISGIFGYDQFAVIIFSTVLSAVIASLVIWMMYMLHLGLLDFFILISPFKILNENRQKIVSSLKPIVTWGHILLFIGVQAVIWDFSSTVDDALQAVLGSGFILAGFNVTPGFIFTVIFVFYAAVLASKGIQALLLSRVLPRYGAEKGVQLSIARLVHYAILTLGFLIMLRVLGFQLNQLTLLGGALGVGIGFGLQAIVNNFASGLILLFERPIKVGDTIQIGTEFGEVKNMGLRATVIQTFDNAEIVVPNSDLITGQVTNWTLAERKIRIRVAIGVAYGTEVAKVLEILLGCAKENPMVLDTPAPSAFFLAFGASSLDFELRVWTQDFLDKTQVLSNLNQDIESEFATNEIEIPFPQTDLHLRSVDELAGSRLGAS